MTPLRRLLEAMASLKLTVTLLALSMVLIFAGTLAQATQGIWETIETYFRSPVAWVDLQLFVPERLARLPLSVPIPGGMLLSALLVVNLLAAHAIRFRLSWRRAGVMLLHAGLILLLAGEFVTATMAREGMMSIDEGSSSNYIEDIRTVEFAVVDRSNPDHDTIVTVPQSMVVAAARSGERIDHPALPFGVTVQQWMDNSQLVVPRGPTTATHGIGTRAQAMPVPPVAGVDGGATDAPSAYVTLWDNDRSLGTWLISANLGVTQTVQTAEGPRDVALWFRRSFRPYTLHLIDFRHDKFVGTEVPRNFSSQVRLVDPTRGVDREVLIYMNHPLRYAGETFYQASYKPDNTGTVLQVVRNPGWLIPYIACVVVGGGMLLHFMLGLLGFLRRTAPRRATESAQSSQAPPASPQRWLPWVVGAAGMVIALSGLLRPQPETAFDLDTFGRLPVSAGGRVKPMDTVARNALMVAGGRQSVKTEDQQVSATQFLLDLMARPEAIKDLPVVRVDHPDLLALLGRSPEEGGRIALAAVEPHWEAVAEQAQRAQAVPARQREPFQRAVLDLHQKVTHLLMLSHLQSPYVIAPLTTGEQWRPFGEAFHQSPLVHESVPGAPPVDPTTVQPSLASYVAMLGAYHEQDAAAFNAAVRAYHGLLEHSMGEVTRKADLEVLFNRSAPFLGATAVYVLAFVVIMLSLLRRLRAQEGAAPARGDMLRRSAVALLWAGFIVQTLGIAARIYLQGRPPVTNLYSSAVFIGWAAVLLGIGLERLFPLGLAALGAAIIGTGTLIVAHNLGNDGDTMQMMQAVLDSNFWLATHVITITLGYSTTFLAGAMGAIYLILGVYTRYLTPDRAKALSKMVYGVVCFSLLLSFVGTVLGGIWADQSWGRFWGWDPKENGAALVVLINAIILHARWGGLVRDRGIMVLAVGGNIVTTWSWFGTNMLGVGLHSYGFMDKALAAMLIFVASQLLIMSLGLLPRSGWRSGPKPG